MFFVFYLHNRVSTYKPLLRDSTLYKSGTYIDSVFKDTEVTPLIDDIEYNLDLDCKQRIYKDEAIKVTYLNPEEQMCMYEISSVPVDLFSILREFNSYSIPLDVQWLSNKEIRISNEDIGLAESYLPNFSLNMTRISESTKCEPLYK